MSSLNNIMEEMKFGVVKFKPEFRTWNYLHTSVIVVGCGGTGGRLIPILAQHIANHNKHVSTAVNTDGIFLKHNMNLVLIDMDIVEAKNLKRQNFYSFDVGRNKAECLAERFSALYGIDISYFAGTFEEANDFYKNTGSNRTFRLFSENNIIFDCTDNRVARESIERLSKSGVIISCGNEDTFGQVIVSSCSERKYSKLLDLFKDVHSKFVADGKSDGVKTNYHSINFTPTLLMMKPFFKDSATAGCAEVALQNEQSMPINMLVAQLAYNAFYDIVSGIPLNYNIVKCNINNTYHTSFFGNSKKTLDSLCDIIGFSGADKIKANPTVFSTNVLSRLNRWSMDRNEINETLNFTISNFGLGAAFTIAKSIREGTATFDAIVDKSIIDQINEGFERGF